MEIQVKESTMVPPAQKRSNYRLGNSDLDLLKPASLVPTVYFYRRTDDNSSNFFADDISSNFFDAGLLKESLSNVLVPFYPMAGRMGRGENGRIEIQCNGEGVLFIEAETNCIIDDFGDFSSGLKLLQLAPAVDDTKDIFSYPLLMIQVTHFKCGGVCLGIRLSHMLADGTSTHHFINSWAEVTRGFPISTPLSFDRTKLDAGVPPSPTFHHIEYNPPPSMNIEFQSNPESVSTAILTVSHDQINTLKLKLKKDHGSTVNHSRFEILVAHIWRCVCKARGLSNDQASKIYIPVNGRSKLSPPLPSGYVGNVVFLAASIGLSGDILSEPLNDTVERIHIALKHMDDKYMKSALAYLKNQSDLKVLLQDAKTFECPNLIISKLASMPMYGANFGWGQPLFVRHILFIFDGMAHILPSPTDDGSWILVINLETNHLQLFKKLFYETFFQCQNVRCRY